jgi:hypothetical protein
MPTYDYLCSSCDRTEYDVYIPLWFDPHVMSCGHEGEKLMTRLGRPAATGYPYKTKNIMKDGSEVLVESPSHEKQLCEENGVVKRDDAAWVNQEWQGWDFRKKKQRYKEGNGVGMPGCWI